MPPARSESTHGSSKPKSDAPLARRSSGRRAVNAQDSHPGGGIVADDRSLVSASAPDRPRKRRIDWFTRSGCSWATQWVASAIHSIVAFWHWA